MYYPIVTLAVGILWTIVGFSKDDFQYLVGAQVWFATTVVLSSMS